MDWQGLISMVDDIVPTALAEDGREILCLCKMDHHSVYSTKPTVDGGGVPK